MRLSELTSIHLDPRRMTSAGGSGEWCANSRSISNMTAAGGNNSRGRSGWKYERELHWTLAGASWRRCWSCVPFGWVTSWWWTSWQQWTWGSSCRGEAGRQEPPEFLFSSTVSVFCLWGYMVVGGSCAIYPAHPEAVWIIPWQTVARVYSVWINNKNNSDTMSLHKNHLLWATTMTHPAITSV